MAITLNQLLSAVSADQIKGQILTGLQGKGFPITDWAEGGVERTLIESEAAAQSDLSALIPQIAAGGLTALSSGRWLTLLAADNYALDRYPALPTIGTEALYTSTAGPYTILPGSLKFAGAGGNIYSNTTGGVVAPTGFSAITHTGAGLGTFIPTAADLPAITTGITIRPDRKADANGYNYLLTITQTGAAGVGYAILYYTDANGANPVPSGLGPYERLITNPTIDPLTGLTLNFTGSFTQGDTYTFAAGGRLALTVQSEHPNDSANGFNYTDTSDTITGFVTPLPGVTVSNPPSMLGTVVHSGSGFGVVTPYLHDYVATPINSVLLTITASGAAGVATFTYSVSGAPAAGPFFTPVSSLYTDATLTAANLSLHFSAQNYTAGDTYYFTVPGTWVGQQGTDEESDLALLTRCAARWPALSAIPTTSVYELWARQASAQVARISVTTDPDITNQVNIIVAGQAGALPGAVLNQIQSSLAQRAGLTDVPVVSSVVTFSVSLATNIVQYHQSSNLQAVQAAAQQAVSDYILSLPISSASTPIYVRVLDIVSAISTGCFPGRSTAEALLTSSIVDVLGPNGTPQDFRLNGVVGNLAVPATQMAIVGSIVNQLTWTPVP